MNIFKKAKKDILKAIDEVNRTPLTKEEQDFQEEHVNQQLRMIRKFGYDIQLGDRPQESQLDRIEKKLDELLGRLK